jgi:TolB-like protein/tetratricopeptide (TPR) repeat protein
MAPGDINARFDPRRVAVLYFDDLSGEGGELGHVADGLTEALIDELGLVRELEVVSANGVAQYRGQDVTPDSVGRALGVGSVIDGSVESTGDRLRVNLRLVDAESGVDIDRTGLTMPAADVLQVRDSVVTSAAAIMRERLGEEVRLRERRAETASVEAWTHVQRAERLRKEYDEVRRQDSDRALELLTEADSLLRVAEALDPQWTEPTVLRAQVARFRAGPERTTEERLAALREGAELASNVISREPNNARAWEARGRLRHYQYRANVSPTPEEQAALLNEAQSDLERAVQLDGSLGGAMSSLASLYQYDRGESLSGALMARRALDADAYLREAQSTLFGLFWATYDLGQFDQARRTCAEARARLPDYPLFTQCELWLMIAPTEDVSPADVDAAWNLVERVDSLTSPDERPLDRRVSQIIVGGVLARASMPDSARAVLLDARAGPEIDPRQELAGYEAIMRGILGDDDEAIQLLRRYASANPGHRNFEVDGELHWWWRPLRDHPGFQSVVSN